MMGDFIQKSTPSGTLINYGKDYGGTSGFSDGFGTNAMFSYPQGLAADKDGNIYVADTNNRRIRKISPSNYVSTIAGSGNYGQNDGTGTDASFGSPTLLAFDSSRGNLFVTDTFYSGPLSISYAYIRKITSSGVVSTLVGSGQGYADGIGTNARFSSFSGISVGNGNIFVSDNSCIRKISFSPSLPGPLPVCDATYHHIALTYSGSSSSNILSAYIDGAKVASTTSTFSISSSSSSSSSLRIGWNGLSSPNSEFFSGSLSDIRIYNRSLSPTEILSISQPPLPTFALTDNPQPQSESSTYTWKCSAGAYGPTVSLLRSPSDGTWAFPVGSIQNCTSCPVGSSSLAGSLSCTLCPAGSFSIVPTLPTCALCPAGSFSTTTGSSSQTTCTPCLSNTYSYPGSSSCAPCS